MDAFVIATIKVKNKDKLQEYAAAAGPTVAAHGGELVMRGAFGAALAGQSDPHMTGIIKFPDLAAAQKWYGSEAYQAIIPLRDEACDMTLLAYTVPQ